MTRRTDADLTDAEIFAVGEPLELRAREIRAREDARLPEAPGERDELIADIVRLDRKDDPATLGRKHLTYLRLLAEGAWYRAAGRLAGEMAGRRTLARIDAERLHHDSVSNVLGTLNGMRARGLPGPRDAEADARRASASNMSNAWTRATSNSDPDDKD